jgi:hypothetical protein
MSTKAARAGQQQLAAQSLPVASALPQALPEEVTMASAEVPRMAQLAQQSQMELERAQLQGPQGLPLLSRATANALESHQSATLRRVDASLV